VTLRFILLFCLVLAGCANHSPNPFEESRNRDSEPFSDRDRAVLAELNRARENPSEYAKHLEAREQFYSGNILKVQSQTPIETKEGVAALREAISALRATDSLPELTFSRGLALAARDHVRDQGPRGAVGHEGSDLSTPVIRANRHSSRSANVAEVISYGPSQPADVITDLLIDDGVPDRGHRTILLERSFRFAGVSCGPHAKFHTMCVIELSPNYSDAK
jgi:uncharacterized protein YkwD